MTRRRATALPIAQAEVDLSAGTTDGLPALAATRVLVRDGDRVLGVLAVSSEDASDAAAVVARARAAFGDATWPAPVPAVESPYSAADVSVVVCSRDRPDLLEGCLEALLRSDPPPGEVLVIDSASRTDETRRVAHRFGARVIREDRPGLDRARNLGWRSVSGPLVMYVDDDARVDRRAVEMVARTMFDPSIGMVSGLVLPAEIVTDAQRRFERNGGMSKGFQRRIFNERVAPLGLRTYEVGVGALMAYQRDLLERVGGFDPLLDVGTATRGAGDLDGFYKVLSSGASIVYEPSCFARHVHRRDHRAWWRQMIGYGYGYTAYIERQRLHREVTGFDARSEIVRWHVQRRVVQLARALRRRRLSDVLELLAEGYGSLWGASAYRRELRAELAATARKRQS